MRPTVVRLEGSVTTHDEIRHLLAEADCTTSRAPEQTTPSLWWGIRGAEGWEGVAAADTDGRTAFLRTILVRAGRRGQGFGARLVFAALEDLRGAGHEHAYLRAASTAPYFAAWGFERVSDRSVPAPWRRRGGPPGAEAAAWMRLSLARSVVRIRPARPADAAAIARIYNQGIEDRIATLETGLRTEADRMEWLRHRDPRYGVLVAETADEVVGWFSLNPFSVRQAYRFVADFSLYVERAWRGRGVGARLLDAGIRLARRHGFHKLVLTMLPENEAARHLYRRYGFEPVGVFHEQGWVDGRWRDTLVMERIL